MTQITFKANNGQAIASGILGQDIVELEGYYYFSSDKVDLSDLVKQEKAYTCHIKNSTCDYYFVKDAAGNKVGREVAWIYPVITNSLFKSIEGKVGLYPRGSDGLEMESVIQ